MKNLIILLALLIASPAIADDDNGGAPAPVVNVTVTVSTGALDFAGFSVGTIRGDQGILAMHALCQLDFGPDARMCTSEEYFTSTIAVEPTTRSWLHPTIVGSAADFGANTQQVDFSGFLSPRFRTLSCSGWQGQFDRGLALEALAGGKPVENLCSDPIAVTCCAPAE